MCGIVGFKTNMNELPVEDLASGVASLLHRGPDDSGMYVDRQSGVGLGHRRLAVIDPTASGRQPMASEDGTLVLVYDGEIYNFKEVRDSLRTKGHVFHTQTDTEVILRLTGSGGSIACSGSSACSPLRSGTSPVAS
jgi:asparagine synthase (glutamine-hydrolysing)